MPTPEELARENIGKLLYPKEVYGDDPSTLLRAGFPGDTFRVLNEKEV